MLPPGRIAAFVILPMDETALRDRLTKEIEGFQSAGPVRTDPGQLRGSSLKASCDSRKCLIYHENREQKILCIAQKF